MKPPRRTHPPAPLYFPPSSAPVPTQEVIDVIGDTIPLLFENMTDDPTPTQIATILDNAALTGVPTAPTPTVGDNSTKVATTAFVLANAGSLSRGNVAVTTASLANNAEEQGVIALGKSSLVLRFTGSAKCRLRLYSTAAYRTADVSRIPGVDPLGEHGIMLDIVLPLGNLTWDLSPLSLVTNDDTVPSSNIYYAIQNLSGSTAAITATVTRIPIET